MHDCSGCRCIVSELPSFHVKTPGIIEIPGVFAAWKERPPSGLYAPVPGGKCPLNRLAGLNLMRGDSPMALSCFAILD